MIALNRHETESIMMLCLMASFVDGDKHERERQQIRKISTSLADDEVDMAALCQEVLLNKPDPATVTARLQTPESRQLAYEMALCVCDADDVRNDAEIAFLNQLRTALGLQPAETKAAEATASALTTMPMVAAPPVPEQADETHAMVLRYAVVAGALELLPQTMATLAIIPIQTKMVYRIGKQRGFELDRKSIGEFMATVGLGLASQVIEGFARRLTRGLGKKVGGKMGGKIGDAVGGMAMSFASTYALGRLAQLYYDSGRTLGIDALKSKYTPLLEQGKVLAQQYTAQIAQQSQQLQGANLNTLLKGAI